MDPHKGFPIIDETKCKDDCKECVDACPTNAIIFNPLSIDLGKSIFCSECEKSCSFEVFKFTKNYKLGNIRRNKLIISAEKTFEEYFSQAIETKREIHSLFGRLLS